MNKLVTVLSIQQCYTTEAAKILTEGQGIKKLTARQSYSASDNAEDISKCIARSHKDIGYMYRI